MRARAADESENPLVEDPLVLLESADLRGAVCRRRRPRSGPRGRALRSSSRRTRGPPRPGGVHHSRSACPRSGTHRWAASRRHAGARRRSAPSARAPAQEAGRNEAVERAHPVDGPHDRVDGDRADTEVALTPASRAPSRPLRRAASPTRHRARTASERQSTTTPGGGAGGRNQSLRRSRRARVHGLSQRTPRSTRPPTSPPVGRRSTWTTPTPTAMPPIQPAGPPRASTGSATASATAAAKAARTTSAERGSEAIHEGFTSARKPRRSSGP